MQGGRILTSLRKVMGNIRGCSIKAWKVKTRTKQEINLRKRWEQKSKCVYRRREKRCRGLTGKMDGM